MTFLETTMLILSEPLLAIPIIAMWSTTIVLTYLVFKRQIKRGAANIASLCISKKPKWGENDQNLELLPDMGSYKRALDNLEKKTQELEIKINKLDKKQSSGINKNKFIINPLTKGVIIKAGKFKPGNHIQNEHGSNCEGVQEARKTYGR